MWLSPHAIRESWKTFLVCFMVFSVLVNASWKFMGFEVLFPVRTASAATVSVVQSSSAVTGGSGDTIVGLTLGATPATGNLLIAVCGSPSTNSFNITSTGTWSTAILRSATTSQGIFYKVAVSGEATTVNCNASTSAHLGLQVFEYSGLETNSPFIGAASSTGTGTSTNSGTLATTTQPDALIFAAITIGGNTSFSATSSNSFVKVADFQNGSGNPGIRGTYAGYHRTVTSTGSFVTAPTAANSGNWIGEIAAFKANMMFEQSAYRWFDNANATSVGSPNAALNTAGTVSNAGDILRLRMLIHVSSSQLIASGRNFKLQYVAKGAGTCAAPSGSSPSTYTDLATSTGALRFADNGGPADGDALSATSTDPTHGGDTVVNQTYEEQNNFTNSQGTILTGQDGKWDFAILNSSGQSGETYCFRAVESDGTVFDTYTQYPQMIVGNVGPSITNVTLNGGADIPLTEGTSTLIHASATVTDLNGFNDLNTVNAVFYRTGVTSTLSCTANDNNCYIVPTSSCSFTNCSGNSCVADCTANIRFHADPTDPGTPWESEGWQAWMRVVDDSNATSSATSTEVDMLTLLGIQATPLISYGSLSPGSTTDPLSNLVIVSSTGNASMDVAIYGTNMTAGSNSIPINQQRFATSTMGYASSGVYIATSSPGETIDVSLRKTLSTTTLATSTFRWGIRVPNPQPTGNYSGQNAFIGVMNPLPWP